MGRESEEEEPLTAASLAAALLDVDGDDGDGNAAGPGSTTGIVFFSTFVAACGQFAYGCAAGYQSQTESGMINDLGLSIAEYSVFASAMTFGGILGALINGKVADLSGRRGAMWLSNILGIIGWLAIIFAKDVWWLDVGRLSMGVGYMIIVYVTNIYVAEITPRQTRGALTACNVMMLVLGVSLMFVIGNFLAWRTLAICALVPSVVQTIGLFFVPESPRWLAKINRETEMATTLQRLRGKDVDIYLESAAIMEHTKTFEQLSKGSIFDLFQRKYAHSLVIGIGIMLLVQFGGNNGILSYASSIFEDAGASSSVGTTCMAIIQIPFTALNVVLVDKIGRRPLLMASAAGTCLGNILAGLAFLFQDLHYPREIPSTLVLSGILVFSASTSAGLNGTPWILVSEIFPVNIRGVAGSLVVFCLSVSSWIVIFSFNFIFEWSSAGIFFTYAAFCGAIVIFVAKLVPETNGRSLEEIQASLTLLQQ